MILTLLAWAGLIGVFGIVSTMLWNLFLFRRPAPQPSLSEPPLISILIPARNEARRIAPLLRSLASQTYPNVEILLLDDHSTDDTRIVVENVARETGLVETLQVLPGRDLPPGWTGKAWACHQLAQTAQGDILLFTDADTIHTADSVLAAFSHLRLTRAGLLSAWPRQITRSLGEILVVPLIPFLILGMLPMWQLWLAQRSTRFARLIPQSLLQALGAANGQFMMFTRPTYDACGGHSAVKSHLVEDVALGRRVAALTRQGHRLVNCDGSRMVACRMYENMGEVWEGFTKNLRAGFDNAAVFVFSLVFQWVVCVLPFFLWPFEATRPMALIAIAGLLGMRILLAWRCRTSWWSVPLHPIGYLLALTIACNSWRRTGTQGVTWKGRTYGVGNPD